MDSAEIKGRWAMLTDTEKKLTVARLDDDEKRELARHLGKSDSSDFLTSAAIGAVTGSALLGGLLGGSLTGGLLGDALDGDIFD